MNRKLLYHRQPRRRGWLDVAARADTYRTGILCGIVVSLSVLLLLVHLPLGQPPEPVGWHVVDRVDRETISMHEIRSRTAQESGVPVTHVEEPSADREEEDGNRTEPEERSAESTSGEHRSRYVEGLKVVSVAHEMPKIVGGIGAFYVHIEYPEEAVRKQIEGRLVLSFIVNTDGETEDVHVVKSLHPLCDSAAVAALRETQFVPGRQDGEVVPVHMHLPVRFKLVSTDDRERP